MHLLSLDNPVGLGKFSNLTHEWGAEILYELGNKALANKLYSHGQMIDNIIINHDVSRSAQILEQARNNNYSDRSLDELYELAFQFIQQIQGH